MLERVPEPIKILTQRFSEFPGIGPKSALRIVMELLNWPEEKVVSLGQEIVNFRSRLSPCSFCQALTERDPCPICSDPARDDSLLCVVVDLDSMFVLEEPGFYKGKYFILGGLLSPLEGKEFDTLNLDTFRKRLAQKQLQEVILALGSTVEAENTASYLKNLVKKEFPFLNVTRLAQGIPLGAEVKYMDRETLRQSLTFRQKF
ncbi:MAG: recombination mediator RecR [Desulfonauticus sp.]|nr:recombination mediator RecR [Desulfonauticus sp.]